MAGTTQPGQSEDLWAQVAMVQPTFPHTVADDQSVVVSSKGGVNAVSDRGHGGVSLNLDAAAEGSVPNCGVPDA